MNRLDKVKRVFKRGKITDKDIGWLIERADLVKKALGKGVVIKVERSVTKLSLESPSNTNIERLCKAKVKNEMKSCAGILIDKYKIKEQVLEDRINYKLELLMVDYSLLGVD